MTEPKRQAEFRLRNPFFLWREVENLLSRIHGMAPLHGYFCRMCGWRGALLDKKIKISSHQNTYTNEWAMSSGVHEMYFRY